MTAVALPTVIDLWLAPIGLNAKSSTCSESFSTAIPICAAFKCRYDWEGHPLRKDYPMRGPAKERSPRPAFAGKTNVVAGTPPSGRTLEALQEQVKRARDDMSSALPVDAEMLSRGDNTMVLSMGPQHPSTHGVLQIVLEIDRRERRQGRAGDRLPAHRHRENRRRSVLDASADGDRAHGLPCAANPTRSVTHWPSKSCSA